MDEKRQEADKQVKIILREFYKRGEHLAIKFRKVRKEIDKLNQDYENKFDEFDKDYLKELYIEDPEVKLLLDQIENLNND